VFFGVMLACLYAVSLMVRGRAGALTRLPLGSFLGLAGLIAAIFGTSIIVWYSSLFV